MPTVPAEVVCTVWQPTVIATRATDTPTLTPTATRPATLRLDITTPP